MSQTVLGLRDRIVNALSSTKGEQLEITANLTSSAQVELVMESMALEHLGRKFAVTESEKMLRLSCSWQGKSRNDLVEIGKTPEFAKNRGGIEDF